jgi:hypothetical protein
MYGTFGVDGVLELLCLGCYELRHWDWFWTAGSEGSGGLGVGF